MKRVHYADTVLSLYKKGDKPLIGWDLAIAEAKLRIKELKQSLRTFQDLRDSGMVWPEPKSVPKPKLRQRRKVKWE